MLDSKTLTKMQSIILIAVIIVAAAGGVATYVFFGGEGESSDAIKIGVLADLDALNGKHVLQGVILASEQLNAEGGILGKRVEVVGEDTDAFSVWHKYLVESIRAGHEQGYTGNSSEKGGGIPS